MIYAAFLDNDGRLISPKFILNYLGLQVGSMLEIEENNHDIILKALDVQPQLKVEEGILVFTGKMRGNAESVLKIIRTECLTGLEDF